MPDLPAPDDRIIRDLDRNSPEYRAILTDPMIEVDEAFATLKAICARYGLDYFVMVLHHGTGQDAPLRAQYSSAIEAGHPIDAFYEGLDIQINQLSGGTVRVVPVDEDLDNAGAGEEQSL